MGALSLIVGAVACVPAALAVALRGRIPVALTGLLTHAAATGFLVAIASSDRLAAHTTWLLQKSADGSIAPLSKLLFWPYHLGLRSKLYIQRRKSVEPLYDQLAAPNDRLYIGGWPEQPGWLPSVQPAILDVTCELPRTYADSEYLMLPTWDTQAPNTLQIQQGVDWAKEQLAAGQSVYIHCAHGHGRSATVLAALLIATGQATTAEEAVEVIRRARPRVRLNKPQAAAVKAWIEATAGGKCRPAGSTADVCMADGSSTAAEKKR